MPPRAAFLLIALVPGWAAAQAGAGTDTRMAASVLGRPDARTVPLTLLERGDDVEAVVRVHCAWPCAGGTEAPFPAARPGVGGMPMGNRLDSRAFSLAVFARLPDRLPGGWLGEAAASLRLNQTDPAFDASTSRNVRALRLDFWRPVGDLTLETGVGWRGRTRVPGYAERDGPAAHAGVSWRPREADRVDLHHDIRTAPFVGMRPDREWSLAWTRRVDDRTSVSALWLRGRYDGLNDSAASVVLSQRF